MKPTIDTTIALIRQLHEGQTDWAGVPYWHHPVAVMNLLPSNSPDDRRFIALLHDTLEDCLSVIAKLVGLPENTPDILQHGATFLKDQGYSQHVVDGVLLLTRTKGVAYINEIRQITASGHLDAMWVKLCDNTHNTDPVRTDKLSPKNRAQALYLKPRYERSMAILQKEIVSRVKSNIIYTNYRGETAVRNIEPLDMRHGSTEWHPQPQWLLAAMDLDQNVEREFAFNEIQEIH